MKEAILAQVVAREFLARPEVAGRFDRDDVALKVLAFLKLGPDDDDRVQAIRLSLQESNRRSDLASIIARADEILNWPPAPKPVPAPTPEPAPKIVVAQPKVEARRSKR
jgi:hypothetical protein